MCIRDRSRAEAQQERVQEIPLSELHPFEGHPFRVVDEMCIRDRVKMVADVYSHIIDDDRRLNAERMEAAFYSGRQATPEPVQPCLLYTSRCV